MPARSWASALRAQAGPAITASAVVMMVLRSIIAASDGTMIAEPASDRFSTSRYGCADEGGHQGSGSSGM